VLESKDPQDKAYRISFTRCSIERCRGNKRRKPQGSDALEPPDASQGKPPGEPEP
jgi:hypothetical protein